MTVKENNFFEVGQCYEAIIPNKNWIHWVYNEETKEWSDRGNIIAEKFLLLKIIQIGDCDYGKFLASSGQVTFYRLKKNTMDDFKKL
jgi:hypothetical protein